jgi:hypothetical protein
MLDERSDVELDDRKPCPSCGSRTRTYEDGATVRLTLTVSASEVFTRIRETVEHHPTWTLLTLLLVVVGPFVGLVFPGAAGVLLGLSLSLLALSAGARASRLVRREIEERHYG